VCVEAQTTTVDLAICMDQPMRAACAVQMFEEAGTDLAQALTQKDAMAKKKSAMPADVAKALARVSSGLYVVTAAHEDYRYGSAAQALAALCLSEVLTFALHRLHCTGWSSTLGQVGAR
jgi:hypothetical protein